MQLPGISPTIPATDAPTDLSRVRLAIVVGNQIMSVPADGLGSAFGFQPLDSDLTAIAALSTTAYGRSLLESVSASALFASIKQTATDTATGAVELATNLETQTGTDATRAVTPAGLRSATRELLLANRTYYVRSDGSNSNTGLVNNAGGAFLTIAKAISTVLALDLSTFNVTIQLGAGTWSEAVSVSAPWVGSGVVTLLGDAGTPANVTISAAACVSVNNTGSLLTISGLTLNGTTNCLVAASGGTIKLSTGIVFAGNSSSGHMRTNGPGSSIEINANYTITSGAARHFQVSPNGYVNCFNRTVTLSGTLNFSTAFAQADRGALISTNASTFTGGTITGKRYDAATNAVIFTGGAGASHFPGDVAGTTATGGQYA